MDVVLLFPGWSGNSTNQNFNLLISNLITNEFSYEIVDYLHHDGSLKKVKTMDECLKNAESRLKEIRKSYSGNVDFIALGHSLGAIVLRMLIERGNSFKEAIFAGGPHEGYLMRSYFWKLPIAFLLRVKIIFDLAPGSDFLKSLGPLPEGTYIGSINDKKVSLKSAIPGNAKGLRLILLDCSHDMFPCERKKVKSSAIPLVIRRIGDL